MYMQLSKKFFSPLPNNDIPDPKDQNHHEDNPVSSDNPMSDSSEDANIDSDPKSFKASLRDALQEWSNDDARDIAEDDSTPLRSGL